MKREIKEKEGSSVKIGICSTYKKTNNMKGKYKDFKHGTIACFFFFFFFFFFFLK
jgi:hypothetical protein